MIAGVLNGMTVTVLGEVTQLPRNSYMCVEGNFTSSTQGNSRQWPRSLAQDVRSSVTIWMVTNAIPMNEFI